MPPFETKSNECRNVSHCPRSAARGRVRGARSARLLLLSSCACVRGVGGRQSAGRRARVDTSIARVFVPFSKGIMSSLFLAENAP